jgi:glycosyltransferase involved in cell wall biosynthesis
MNGCATVEKGALLLIEAIDILKRELPPRSFRLLIFGGMMDKARALLRHPEVEYRGFYRPDELNRILEEADVGIIPSIWEEAYGYIGVEMLAKGVPVIGNKRGGIVDYVKPGLTGWINSESTGAGLAAIMRDIIEDPAVVVRLNASIRAQQSDILKTMSQHVEEMAAIYDQARRHRAGADVKTAA